MFSNLYFELHKRIKEVIDRDSQNAFMDLVEIEHILLEVDAEADMIIADAQRELQPPREDVA